MESRTIFSKVILLTLLILVSTVTIVRAYEDLGVSVSIKGRKSFTIKKQAQQLAEKQVISNYLLRVNPGAAGSRCEKSLIDDRAALIFRTSRKSISQIGDHVEASFLIRVDDKKINRRMEELGCGAQSGSSKIIMLVMEEPPSSSDISMALNGADASGTRKLRGLGPFVIFYTSYQRAIRDSIIEGATREGLKITRLDNLKSFKKMKMSDEDPMVGVYFDTESEEFVINHRLIDFAKNQFAKDTTIILYYRINSLYFDQVSRKLKATIALSVQNLKDGNTKSVGSQEFMVLVPEGQPGLAIRDGLAEVASSAATLLMNDARKEAMRMVSIAQAQKNNNHSVVKLQLNSKRAMYKIKKNLTSKSVKNSNIENGELIINLSSGISADDFVFGELLNLLEKNGISIPDKNIKIGKKESYIKQ